MLAEKAIYSFSDLDWQLIKRILDFLGIQNLKNPNLSLQEVIELNLNNINMQISDFYGNTNEIIFDISVEDIESKYEEYMG